MPLKCWPNFELQHDLAQAKHSKKTGNLPWQHKLLLRIIQRNIEPRKITEKHIKTHENAEKRKKRGKTQKNIEKMQKNQDKRKNALKGIPQEAPWALPKHVLVALGRSWDTLGRSWNALGSLLGASCPPALDIPPP